VRDTELLHLIVPDGMLMLIRDIEASSDRCGRDLSRH
jgi:hypothetical protein